MQSPLKPEVNAMDLFEWALEQDGANHCDPPDRDQTAAIIASVAQPLAVRRLALELLDAHCRASRLMG